MKKVITNERYASVDEMIEAFVPISKIDKVTYLTESEDKIKEKKKMKEKIFYFILILAVIIGILWLEYTTGISVDGWEMIGSVALIIIGVIYIIKHNVKFFGDIIVTSGDMLYLFKTVAHYKKENYVNCEEVQEYRISSLKRKIKVGIKDWFFWFFNVLKYDEAIGKWVNGFCKVKLIDEDGQYTFKHERGRLLKRLENKEIVCASKINRKFVPFKRFAKEIFVQKQQRTENDKKQLKWFFIITAIVIFVVTISLIFYYKNSYDYVGKFVNGRSVVIKNEKCGVIDEDKNIVIPLEYEYIEPFINGDYTNVQQDRKYGLIDKWGNLLTEIKYSMKIKIETIEDIDICQFVLPISYIKEVDDDYDLGLFSAENYPYIGIEKLYDYGQSFDYVAQHYIKYLKRTYIGTFGEIRKTTINDSQHQRITREFEYEDNIIVLVYDIIEGESYHYTLTFWSEKSIMNNNKQLIDNIIGSFKVIQ
jgi:hypothetical protein